MALGERELRTILLVKAVEDSDAAGVLLPTADRAEATRAAARGGATGERLLLARATQLRERLESRHPFLRDVVAAGAPVAWLGLASVAIAFVAGGALAALDGERRINLLAFPLLAMLAWNLLVYVALLGYFVANRARPAERPGRLTDLYVRHVHWRLARWMQRSARFHAPLAQALSQFARDWQPLALPVLLRRARGVLHLAAAALALGLLAGLYVRGIGFRYDAAWESTFLTASQVHSLLHVVYGPASAITGIALPASDAAVETWRAMPGGVGGDAAPWIHLIAVTALVFIVLPRLVLAGFAWLAAARVARWPKAVPALDAYARTVLGESSGLPESKTLVLPYAYVPTESARAELARVLRTAQGTDARVRVAESVGYGAEESLPDGDSLGLTAGESLVVLMSAAATPETENHGALVSRLRDRAAAARTTFSLLIDLGPLARRLRGDRSLTARLDERRQLWQRFAKAHGVRVTFADLEGRESPAPAPP